jgi:hypothetical protein
LLRHRLESRGHYRTARHGKIPAITWNTPNGVDKLGVIAKSRGVLFVKRDDQGQLGTFFVQFSFSPTRFGGWRAWFRCPGCRQACRVLYGTNSLRCRNCRGLAAIRRTRARARRSYHVFGRDFPIIVAKPKMHSTTRMRVDIESIGLTEQGQRYRATYAGDILAEGRRNPIFDACRALLARGITGWLEVWRTGKTSADMQLDIERGAGLAICETATESLRVVPWRSRPDITSPNAVSHRSEQPPAATNETRVPMK